MAEVVNNPKFLPNPYARCECDITEEFGHDAADYPICTFFEPVPEDDCPDCCKVCRHGADCHLKGHAACHCDLNTPATCIGYVQISGLDADCCECEMPDGSQCCHAQACHGGGR